jgi:hypothetical protein
VKLTTTTHTGAFAVPTLGGHAAASHRERRATGPVGVVLPSSFVGSSTVATASRTASAWNTVDVPTPVPIRFVGAHG